MSPSRRRTTDYLSYDPRGEVRLCPPATPPLSRRAPGAKKAPTRQFPIPGECPHESGNFPDVVGKRTPTTNVLVIDTRLPALGAYHVLHTVVSGSGWDIFFAATFDLTRSPEALLVDVADAWASDLHLLIRVDEANAGEIKPLSLSRFRTPQTGLCLAVRPPDGTSATPPSRRWVSSSVSSRATPCPRPTARSLKAIFERAGDYGMYLADAALPPSIQGRGRTPADTTRTFPRFRASGGDSVRIGRTSFRSEAPAST